jgi:ABC-type amino acid transport substrate-binding protein
MSCNEQRTLIPHTLTVATYTGFFPICYADAGRAAGRDIEFLKRFAEQQELSLNFQFFPFDRIWERPGHDTCDLSTAGIAPLPSRTAAGVVWSVPYFTVQRGLMIRASDQQQLRVIGDFTGRTIAVTRGSTAEHDVLARKPNSAQVVYYHDQQQAISDLVGGIIDGYGTGDAVCYYLEQRSQGLLAIADIHPYEVPETFAFAIRAASGLETALNTFIERHQHFY